MAKTTSPPGSDLKASDLSKTDLAYGILKDRLLNQRYVAGYRLVITELVRETGISTIPWREAIRRLEAEGWLEIVRNVGARVVSFEAASFENTVEVLARLEGYATALGSVHLTPEDLAEAERVFDEQKSALEDFDPIRFSDLNRDFHFLWYDKCADPHLIKLIGNEWNRLRMMGRTAVPGRAKHAIKEHEQLLKMSRKHATFDKIDHYARQHRRNMLEASPVRVVRGAGDID